MSIDFKSTIALNPKTDKNRGYLTGNLQKNVEILVKVILLIYAIERSQGAKTALRVMEKVWQMADKSGIDILISNFDFLMIYKPISMCQISKSPKRPFSGKHQFFHFFEIYSHFYRLSSLYSHKIYLAGVFPSKKTWNMGVWYEKTVEKLSSF